MAPVAASCEPEGWFRGVVMGRQIFAVAGLLATIAFAGCMVLQLNEARPSEPSDGGAVGIVTEP